MTIHFGDGSSQTAAGLAGAGKVLQVVTVNKSNTFSTSSSWADITGLSVSITPASSSNHIVCCYSVNYGSAGGNVHCRVKLVRGSTDIAIGDSDGNRTRLTGGGYNTGDFMRCVAGTYRDSPNTTSSVTYKLRAGTNGNTLYINRNRHGDNAGYAIRGHSCLTLMEVSG